LRPATRRQLLSIARGGDGFQAEVDSHRFLGSSRLDDRNPDRNTHVPVPDGILGKTAVPKAVIPQILVVEYAKVLARKAQALAFALEVEGDPTEGAAAAAAAPVETARLGGVTMTAY
jgi:hypothetical protein